MKTIENIFLHGWVIFIVVIVGGYMLLIVYLILGTIFGLFIKLPTVENILTPNESTPTTFLIPTTTTFSIPEYKPTFNGYPCTKDCSGHEAGREWAEEHGITQDDVDNYSGNSNSFKEGMQSYVDNNE